MKTKETIEQWWQSPIPATHCTSEENMKLVTMDDMKLFCKNIKWECGLTTG